MKEAKAEVESDAEREIECESANGGATDNELHSRSPDGTTIRIEFVEVRGRW